MSNSPYDRKSAHSILEYARKLLGTTLRSALGPAVVGHKIKGKGQFGQILEKHYFKYALNSDSRPDFPEAKLELKATGLVPDGDGTWKAKERVKLNSINFKSVHRESFNRSSFLKKNFQTLLVCYVYEKEQMAVDLCIELADIWRIPEEDLPQIEREWNLIVGYIRDGRAEKLSEGLTNYLGACTSGQGKGKDFVSQPFSTTLAKKRAFSFKQGYVTRIVKEFIARENNKPLPETVSILEAAGESTDADFETVALKRFVPYLGLTEEEIAKDLEDFEPASSENLNRREWLNKAILGVPHERGIKEFEKAGIRVRSFPLKRPGLLPKEDFPFRSFSFTELLSETWEESELRTELLNRFLVAFYRVNEHGAYTLVDAVFWGFPEDRLDTEVRGTWKRTVELVKENRYGELPKSSETKLLFVRTHARSSKTVSKLPNGKRKPTVSFWLYKGFLQEVFDDVGNYPARASHFKEAG